MSTSICPECEGIIPVDGVMVGEILPCAFCGVDLEVVTLSPVELAVAPQVEEDWGD